MRRVGVILARPSGPRLTSTILASTSFTYTSITPSTFDSIPPLPESPTPTTASPIVVELLLEDPDPAQLEIQQPHQLTFTVVDDATLKRKRKLIDNDGYTCNVKRQCVNAMHWQCMVRLKINIAFPENDINQFMLLLNAHLIRFYSFILSV